MFKDTQVEEGFPRPVSDFGLPPGGVDAALSWARSDKTYFFKDQLFWRFDELTRSMDPGHPAPGPPWRGVPRTLDAAMRWSDGERAGRGWECPGSREEGPGGPSPPSVAAGACPVPSPLPDPAAPGPVENRASHPPPAAPGASWGL